MEVVWMDVSSMHMAHVKVHERGAARPRMQGFLALDKRVLGNK